MELDATNFSRIVITSYYDGLSSYTTICWYVQVYGDDTLLGNVNFTGGTNIDYNLSNCTTVRLVAHKNGNWNGGPTVTFTMYA